MKFAIILLSRNRPQQCEESIDRMVDCAAKPENLFFYVIIDDNDPKKQDYEKLLSKKDNLLIHISTSYNKMTSFNDMSEQAYQDGYDVLMFHADDAIFVTSTSDDWDLILQQKIEQVEDRICLCWFNDGFQEHRLATHPIITRQWYEILDYFVPEMLFLSYMDNWLYDIANRIQRLVYIPEVKFEHRHFSLGKAKQDQTYRRNQRRLSFDKFNYDLHAPLRKEHAKMLQMYINKNRGALSYHIRDIIRRILKKILKFI